MDLLDGWAAASARQVGRYISDGGKAVKLVLGLGGHVVMTSSFVRLRMRSAEKAIASAA